MEIRGDDPIRKQVMARYKLKVKACQDNAAFYRKTKTAAAKCQVGKEICPICIFREETND